MPGNVTFMFQVDSLGNSHWETFVQCQWPCSQKQTCKVERAADLEGRSSTVMQLKQ